LAISTFIGHVFDIVSPEHISRIKSAVDRYGISEVAKKLGIRAESLHLILHPELGAIRKGTVALALSNLPNIES
jgi:hypothetical protein